MLEFRKGWTGEKLEVIMQDISNVGLSIDDIADEVEGDVYAMDIEDEVHE